MRSKIIRFTSTLLVLSIFLTSCYGEMGGTVIDAETGKPIEGAVVLVEWTKTKGVPGQTYHEVYKIVEAETNKDGKFTISGTYNPLVDPPDIVVYKKGYVAWRNDYIFPGWEKRTDFKYKDGLTIKLEQFKEDYSKEDHHYFMGHGIIGADFNITPKYSTARSETSKEAQQEIEEKKKKK